MVPTHSPTSVKKRTQTNPNQKRIQPRDEESLGWERGCFNGVTWTPELSGYINCKILDFLLLKLSQCELSTYYSKPRVSTNRTSSYVLIEFSDVICESLCSMYTIYREMNFQGWQWAPSSQVQLPPSLLFTAFQLRLFFFLWSSSFSSLDIPNDKLLEGISLHANTCV